MSHTIYTAIFEQTIIHQRVHLRRENQSHEPVHVLMRLYPIDKSTQNQGDTFTYRSDLDAATRTLPSQKLKQNDIIY
jgi:hypothetical protein